MTLGSFLFPSFGKVFFDPVKGQNYRTESEILGTVPTFSGTDIPDRFSEIDSERLKTAAVPNQSAGLECPPDRVPIFAVIASHNSWTDEMLDSLIV